GKTPEIINLATCAIMVSGSVSLEMLARKTPAVVLYRTSWPTYFLGKLLVTIKYMSLPNLIAGRIVMPEFLSVGNPTPVVDSIVSTVGGWLSDPMKLDAAKKDLDEIRNKIFSTGATKRVAQILIQQLEQHSATKTEDRQAA
ncbi:MAG: lipid-A-disaccharide synthase, partial [Planctomycetes bacterium]|nr:lipid-A-disaccharide synthase [Planctomycetota bacterium]